MEAVTGGHPGPSPKRASTAAAVSWDLCPDLIGLVVEQLTSKHSPFYDDSDVARDAAACACVGHPTLTAIAEQLYSFIAPHYGTDPGVSEASSVADLKAQCKTWGLTVSGSKSVLWQRIQDEVEGVDEDKDVCKLCPVSRAAKRRVQQLQGARWTINKAKDVLGVYKYQVEKKLRGQGEMRATSLGPTTTYRLRDLKQIGSDLYHGNYQRVVAQKQRSKEWKEAFWESYNARKNKGKADALAVLAARGLQGPDAERAVSRHWWMLSDGSPGVQLANEAQEWLFHSRNTSHWAHLAKLRSTYVYRKKSQYRQDIELEKRAYGLALSDWVGSRTLDEVLSHPDMPEHMRDRAQRAWQLRHPQQPA